MALAVISFSLTTLAATFISNDSLTGTTNTKRSCSAFSNTSVLKHHGHFHRLILQRVHHPYADLRPQMF